MTNRRKRVYESIIVGLSIILMALCAYMGITAIQKSMKLNMSFQVNPSIVCKIYAGIGTNANLGSNESLIFQM